MGIFLEERADRRLLAARYGLSGDLFNMNVCYLDYSSIFFFYKTGLIMSTKSIENRLGNFKNRGVMQQDEFRRRREEVAVEIRKSKREESIAKRRNLKKEGGDGVAGGAGADSDSEGEELAAAAAQQNMVAQVSES